MTEEIGVNKEQEEAANFLNGIAATIAVPGSGKTRTTDAKDWETCQSSWSSP